MDNYLQVWYVDEVEKNDEEKVPASYTLIFMPSPHGAGESCASSLTPDEFNTKETLEMDVCNFWDWLIDLRKKKKKEEVWLHECDVKEYLPKRTSRWGGMIQKGMGDQKFWG